jgi:hypothetical protein
MSLSIPWRCERCGASGTLPLEDEDLDDSAQTGARIAAAHDAHPHARRFTCLAGPETVIRLTLPH